MFSDDLKAYYSTCLLNPPVWNMCLKKCHHPNIDSIVLKQRHDGTLLRMFVATGPVEYGEVAVHSHRFPADFFVLTGQVTNYDVRVSRGPSREYALEQLHEWEYHSPLLGGKGLTYLAPVGAVVEGWDYPPGFSFRMKHEDIHTVSCKSGSAWIVSEGPELSKVSFTYTATPEPFTVEGLYVPMNRQEAKETLAKVYRTMIGWSA